MHTGYVEMKFPLLALLSSGPAHGYELKQAFESRFGAVWPPVNIGQVYSTLQRLERDALVHGYEVDQGSRPARHVFEITEAGLRALAEWLNATDVGSRLRDEFFMKLVLSRLAGLAEPLEIIERQRLTYLQELRDLNDIATRAKEGSAVSHLLAEGASLHVQADLKWLDLCEDRIRKGETL
jgi:DNA-binding PadR family transcriptional regulator